MHNSVFTPGQCFHCQPIPKYAVCCVELLWKCFIYVRINTDIEEVPIPAFPEQYY